MPLGGVGGSRRWACARGDLGPLRAPPALTTAGKSAYTLTGTHSTGVKYRVRAAYLSGTSGDNLNYTTYGPYRYFTFTK